MNQRRNQGRKITSRSQDLYGMPMGRILWTEKLLRTRRSWRRWSRPVLKTPTKPIVVRKQKEENEYFPKANRKTKGEKVCQGKKGIKDWTNTSGVKGVLSIQYTLPQSFFMSFNVLKLGFLLGLHPNHKERHCPCHTCKCRCHLYKLP